MADGKDGSKSSSISAGSAGFFGADVPLVLQSASEGIGFPGTRAEKGDSN
jgi:hypothetical protein